MDKPKAAVKKYRLIWQNEKEYRDINSTIVAALLWYLTSADYLLDTKKKCVLKTRQNNCLWNFMKE